MKLGPVRTLASKRARSPTQPPLKPPKPDPITNPVIQNLIDTAVVQLWRSTQANQQRLRSALTALQQESQQVQQQLSTKLADTTATLQSTALEKAALETQQTALKQQCTRLRAAIAQKSQQTQQDGQITAFGQIQTLLTQYPTLRRMAIAKPELPVKNLIATLAGLDNLVQFWGDETIGTPWEPTSYDVYRFSRMLV